ncbi:MAG: flavin reductase [Clostridia bacterium]|jgi:flavin reductase (DIM6/NTAB) family NADH-FMN oxidoreductase RutF|nr:flavin reductase [Clostridia bacterium]
MDKSLLFKIPYGLCLVSTESNGTLGGCIVNTAIQITDEPTNLVVSITKDSHTAKLMVESKKCIIGMISDICNMNIIKHFSLLSGNVTNKFDKKYSDVFRYRLHENIPYLFEDLVCNLICEVKEIVDADSHYLFVLNLKDTMDISKNSVLMTYDMYRSMKSSLISTYICTACHYVYDGIIPFEQLPDDYICPVCGKGKEFFSKIG